MSLQNADLNHLQHTDCQGKIENSKSLVLDKVPELTEKYFIVSFMSGL